MASTILNEYRTPRHFWADAINTACYISNRIFLRSILHLSRFELRFSRKPSVSHLSPFECKCFVLKHGNLYTLESLSFDGIFLDTPLMADLTKFIILRLTLLLSHMM
jgi:hypothetical protein